MIKNINNKQLLNIYNLSSIKTWRNFPNHININFTELNHIYMKSSIFILLSNIIEYKYKKEVNYKNFLDILIGHTIIRETLKDINIEILNKIKKENIIKYIKETKNLTEEEIKQIEFYYKDSFEKYIWNISSSITNQLDYEIIKNNNLNLEYLENQVINNFKNFEKKFYNNKFYNNIKGIEEEINKLNEVFKYLYNSTLQKRWNGIDLTKKLTIAEHQIFVAISFFKVFNNIKNSQQIKYNLSNLLFHDSIEVITKDINSPIKNIENLRNILEKDLENEGLNKVFFNNLPLYQKKFFKKLNIKEPFKDRKINGIKIEGRKGKFIDDYTAVIEATYNKKLGNKLEYIEIVENLFINKYKNSNIIYNLYKDLNIDKNLKNQNIELK